MNDPYLPDPIQPLDVAVVDQDLLWRVEIMNAVRPLYADDFADVASVAERVHPDDPTVLVLGHGLTDSAEPALALLRSTHPNIAVTAFSSSVVDGGLPDIDLVLPDDADDDELADAVRAFVAERQRALPPVQLTPDVAVDPAVEAADARLVLVTSAKGGVGRTTVALNLAAALAHQGAARTVALVETDPVYGDLALMLGLRGPGVNLRSELVLDDLHVLEQCTFPVGDDGLEVVLPPQPVDPWAVIAPDQLDLLVGAVAVDHEWIVVDVSPHLLRGSRLPALADHVYVVSPTELAGLKNATILVAALRDQVPRDHPIELVIVDREGRSRPTEAVASAAGVPVAASVPHDRNVVKAVESQRPVVVDHSHGAARVLRGLAEHTFRLLGAPTPGA